MLSNYDVAVGVDPGLRYLFVAKNDGNIECKKGSVRMNSQQYYNDCKFNWKACKQQRCYKKNQQWMDYSSNMPTSKTNDMNELQNYLRHALNGLDMALQLHVINPFQKWSFKSYLFKQKTFRKILRKITTKRTATDPKTVIVGFGNWGAARDSIIRGHPQETFGPKLQVPMTQSSRGVSEWYVSSCM